MGSHGQRDVTGVTAIMAGISAGGPVFTLVSDLYTDNGVTTAEITWALATTGEINITGQNSGTLDSYDWITPKPPAATYYIRVTPTIGTFSSGSTTGAWLATTTPRSWSRDDGGSIETVTFTAQLATDSGGTNVVATATVSISATIV